MKDRPSEYWDKEKHFTEWLAGERQEPKFESNVPNVMYLENALNFYITDIEAEADVGNYSLDNRVEGVDSNDRYTAVLESQLQLRQSQFQHSHLGKLLLYASGLDADIVVWILPEPPSDKHLQTIEWLNDTKQEVVFLAFVVEILSLDGTQAPYFRKIAGPDDWTSAELPDRDSRERRQAKFWTILADKIQERNSKHLYRKNPVPDNTYSQLRTVDKKGVGLRFRTDSNKNCVKIELSIESEDSKTVYESLEPHQDEIEEKINAAYEIEWTPPSKEGSKGKAVLEQPGFHLSNTQDWDFHHGWLISKGERFVEVFSEYLEI